MEMLWNWPGADADSLPTPGGLDRYAVLRSIDKERLREQAPDLGRERLQRIVRIRDEIRRGVYDSPERLDAALGRLDHALRRRESDSGERELPWHSHGPGLG